MRLNRIVDWALNALAFFVVILLSSAAADRYLFSSPLDPAAPAGPALDAELVLPGVDWSERRATLVLALSTDCAACDQSVDFFGRIIRANSNRYLNMVAVFREPRFEAVQYLELNSLFPDAVVQADLRKLGVIGTPTLILVDKAGRVRATWLGALSPDRESAVLARLRPLGLGASPQQPESSEGSTIDAKQLLELLRTTKVVPIMDIRPREEFRAGHIEGALSIPLDELDTRMPHEVPTWPTVVVYCNYCPSCEASSGDQGIISFCGIGGRVIKQMGYQIKLIRDDLAQLRQAGVKVRSGTVKPTTKRPGKAA